MLTGLPLSLIYASRAIGRSPDRGFAWGGFVLAIVAAAPLAIAAFLHLIVG